ncbi:uncharacterized protein B0P05DRAFT_566218 [Gilbertella persicaria]|uniref:uncharacterized protein n=1 Tax=Gilbertella persicaria TaxID=101096 RepID=UPI0022209871|nr:uncharacterized protein B0P05DRAFT_566218 [Gilbertella persicaria]KAI8047354.1 hypothetical protein B0P05DRAFT_566218 [Gilbertella persicaria]
MSLTKADPNKQGWEDSEFPIVCETCLGENPYVRMTKQPYGKECKICQRPYTVFRWLPGTNARYKKTEICQTCAKVKHVCQTCILDLQYGLPVEVRDKALSLESTAPSTDINRQYFAQNLANKVEEGNGEEGIYDATRLTPESRDILSKLARSEPYYKRNRAHLCSFYVKGECKRGDGCPYRHEKPTEGDTPKQNIRDRYHGTNDPVASKLLNRARGHGLTPPEDQNITSLFVTGVEPDIQQEDLRGFFYVFGDIKSIVMAPKTKCAFVNFTTRASAELAAEKIAQVGLNINEHALRVVWARPKPQQSITADKKSSKFFLREKFSLICL